jgi:isoleucyl-tRNA synthetase
VFLLDYPSPNADWDDADLANDMKELFDVRSTVSQALEKLRQEKTIGSSLDAKIVLNAENERLKVLERSAPILNEFFIVSKVEVKPGPFGLLALRADGTKCERCWYYSTRVGESQRFPTLCEKCVQALS